jgi:hypothetical protein
MNQTEIVREYLEKMDCDTPIFVSDMTKLAGENAKMILARLAKDGIIARFKRGVYYKPKETIWGTSVIGDDIVLKRKYIQDENGNIKGYLTGARLFNHLGLTTQVPRMTEIVSNEYKGKGKLITDYGAVVLKPQTYVNNDNYLYQQLLDIIENRTNVHIETEYPKAIIKAFYIDNQLQFETLYKIGMKRGTAAKNLHKASQIVLG